MRDQLLSGLPSLNRWLLTWNWASRLRIFISQSGIDIVPGRLILGSGVLGLAVYLLLSVLSVDPALAALAAVAALLVPVAFIYYTRSRRLKAFEKGFPAAISLLSRALRAGISFTAALEIVANELPQPVSGEFRIVFDEQNYGLPLRDTLLNLADRVPLMDVRFFVTALLIQHETGGNLAELFDNLGAMIRERFRILGDIRVRTAQGRLTAIILMGLPPVMLFLLRIINPDYVGVLFTDTVGRYLVFIALVLQVIGAALLWKIVSIDL